MGNTLKKPMKAVPQEDFEAITLLYDCKLCHFKTPLSFKFTEHNCHHIICNQCISNHINSNLDINAIDINCPAPNCKAIIDPVLCRDMVDDLPYKEWLDRLCCKTIAARRKCYCPYRDCRALIIDECSGPRSFATKSKCPECKRWICFSCQTIWHGDRACDLEKRKLVINLNDMLFMRLIVGEKKKLCCCPKCKMYTELVPKVGYCIVRCRCKTVYCFHCESEVKRLGCKCKGYDEEIRDHNGTIAFKSFIIIFFIGMALWFWMCKVYENEDIYY